LTDNKVLAFAQIYLKRGFSEYLDLKTIIERCRKSGAAMVHLISPMVIGNLRNHEELFFTKKEREIIYAWKKYFWLTHKYKVSLFPDWEIMRGGCCAARQRTYVNPYGDIYPCNFIPKRYGNILTDDLEQVILNMQKDIGKMPDYCPATNSSSSALKKFIQ